MLSKLRHIRIQLDLRRELLRSRWSPQRLDESALGDIDDLARQQVTFWRDRRLDKKSMCDELVSLSETHPSIFVLDISKGRVTVRKKRDLPVPSSVLSGYLRQYQDFLNMSQERIRYYICLLRSISADLRQHDPIVLALDVNDIPIENDSVPIFSFQKTVGSPNILVPDVDFFVWSWYRRVEDEIPYNEKTIKAGFIGSSTGIFVLKWVIEADLNLRLKAAKHFVNSELVDFKIAKAAQTDCAETKKFVESQPYFSKRLPLSAQLRNRFLLSMDGNGVDCSRLATALKSRSALIKHESEFCLFYFPKLRNERDLLTVSNFDEIEQIVERERDSPGTYRAVAESGREFFSRYLERDRVIAYTALLLERYAELYASASS